ncbi:MAG: hypothetical protein NTY19_31825 [Planctomycetota bacterium]|nr:hypothetical protein [Planctomycetota bacterium]
MSQRVLLVLNCAADASYANRSVLGTLYRGRFDRVAFAVSATCPLDAACWNIVASWSPPPDGPECICGTGVLGRHLALQHCFHPRLIDIAQTDEGFEFVVFTEDDCLLSPTIDAAAVRRRCAGLEALTPPIFYCSRETQDWVWAHHATGYPAYLAATRDWSREQLLRNWAGYGGQPLLDAPPQPMFFGFADCAVFRFSFLRRLASDLARLLSVWHEAAIPSAVLYNSSRLGKLDGLALWGPQRDQSLTELLSLLARHDFVHPIKLSLYTPDELLAGYHD